MIKKITPPPSYASSKLVLAQLDSSPSAGVGDPSINSPSTMPLAENPSLSDTIFISHHLASELRLVQGERVTIRRIAHRISLPTSLLLSRIVLRALDPLSFKLATQHGTLNFSCILH